MIATWCQREEPPAFTARERAALHFLYDEWAHPFFVSVQEYGRLLEVRRCSLLMPTCAFLDERPAMLLYIAMHGTARRQCC